MPTEFLLRLGYPWIETPRRTAAAIDFAKRCGADGVMLFNNRGHAEPAHYDREETLRRAEALRQALAACRAAGLRASINNLATVGMNFSPPRKVRLPFQGLIDYDGRMFSECYCPLDPGWLGYVDFLFGTWAGLGPDEVWVDDDFRYKTGAAQCFCPLHLAQFEARTGRAWTRKQLLEALTTEGVLPNETARRWAELQDDALLAAAQRIADAVRRANPKVRIGFMGILFSVYQYGSAYLARIGRTLSPDRPLLIRPEYGAYSDESRNAWNAYTALWASRRAFGENFTAFPEGETWPFARFTHSRKVLGMKLAWGAAHGFTSTTINIADMYDADAVGDDPQLPDAVRAARKHVAAIGMVVDDPTLTPQGVSVELPENRIGWRTKPAYTDFGYLGVRLLGRLGLPLWPHPPGAGAGGDGAGLARVMIGNAVLAQQEHLAEYARRGLLLDRPAFDTLCAMDRDDLSGGARPRPMGGYPCVERFARDDRNGRAEGRFLSLETAIPMRPLLQGVDLPDSQEFTRLSWFTDQEELELSPAAWAREWPGGRIAVLPFGLNDDRSENAVLTLKRKWQVEALLEWLSGRPLPVRVAGAADLHTLYRQSPAGARIVIGLANFSNDEAGEHAELIVPALGDGKPRHVRVLGSAGRWSNAAVKIADGGRVRLAGKLTVPAMEVRLIEIA